MNKDPRLHELVTNCVKAAQNCIIISQQLININTYQSKSEREKRIAKDVESYLHVSETFKHLIDYCNEHKIFDHKDLIDLSKRIINECNNMINQCNSQAEDIYRLDQKAAIQLQVMQNIINNSIPCIEACTEFLHDYENDSLLP